MPKKPTKKKKLPDGAIDLTKVEGAKVEFDKWTPSKKGIGKEQGQTIKAEIPDRDVVAVAVASGMIGNNEPEYDWRKEICERLAKGENLKVALEEMMLPATTFFKELDTNPEFKKSHDEAMGILAKLAQYGLYYLAINGSATDRKALAPDLVNKYGGNTPTNSEGKQEGGADFE